MTEPPYTDDDVAAGAEALYEAAYSLTSLTVTECEGLVEAVLGAVLPAYRKRLLRELADEINETWPDIYLGSRARMWSEAEAWLRAKAEETP